MAFLLDLLGTGLTATLTSGSLLFVVLLDLRRGLLLPLLRTAHAGLPGRLAGRTAELLTATPALSELLTLVELLAALTELLAAA